MQYTENYQYRKPVIGVDVADIKDMNFNSDKTDALIHNTQISLAPAYDLNETYNTGNVVMYETLMYKCKADNVTGAWDASKWERTTAGEEGSGGGGSSVVPNPQGEPTDTLETIEIDGTVYDIAGSGGGGSVRKLYKKLYNGNITSTGDLTLLDSIENYDFIMIEIAYLEGEGNPVCGSTIADVAYLKSTYNNTTSIWIDGGNNDRSAKVAFSDGTTMKVQKASTYDAIIGVYGLDLNGGAGDASEIIPISAGDGTTSRTFTFDKIPKKVSMQYVASGWGFYRDIIWGTDRSYYQASQATISESATYIGVSGIVCDETTKSITITGLNAIQASNTADIVGYMYVEYGGGSGSSEEISDMIWTELISTTGTSTAVAIPQGTKKLVLTAQLGGIVTKVAEESIANIQKLLDVSLETTWNMGGEYADTAGNHTTIAMSVSNGQVVAKSGYSTVTAKVYALS